MSRVRVLLLGPRPAQGGGSLPPYLDVLADALREQGLDVDRHGSAGIPYDTERQQFWNVEHMVTAARALLNGIELTDYDLLSIHCGNLEVEQLLPTLWGQQARPPAVFHVHTADVPTLFRDHRPHPGWHRDVARGLRSLDGYVYFGEHARQCWQGNLPTTVPAGIAWLPTTIPPGTQPSTPPSLAEVLRPPDQRPVLSLYGYAAPWKDAGLLRSAAARMRTCARILLAGPFWDHPDQAGVDLTDTLSPTPVGPTADMVTVPDYLDPPARAALVQASTAGVFPYRAHPSFQGSGALADYLAHGTPVVATHVANMAELIGDAGYLAPPGDADALAAALDVMAAEQSPALVINRAHGRAPWFSPQEHAHQCRRIYDAVLGQHTRKT